LASLWGDLHRLAGVWSPWFFLLIAVTSVWYLAESVGLDAPALPSTTIAAPVDDAGLKTVGQRVAGSLAAVRRADPGLRIELVVFPSRSNGALIFQGQRTAWLVRARANAAFTDPATASVLRTTDARTLDLHQRISEMADPLHFGSFAGYWSKVPWFLFGLALTFLALSGCAIYAIRLADRAKQALDWRGGAQAAWAGMGRWRWVSVTMIAVAFGLLPALFLPSLN